MVPVLLDVTGTGDRQFLPGADAPAVLSSGLFYFPTDGVVSVVCCAIIHVRRCAGL